MKTVYFLKSSTLVMHTLISSLLLAALLLILRRFLFLAFIFSRTNLVLECFALVVVAFALFELSTLKKCLDSFMLAVS